MLVAVRGIRQRLLDDSLLFAGIGTRLYSDMAPTTDSQVFPFGIISFGAGGTDRRARTRRQVLDFTVKVISTNYEEACQLGERIYEALHEEELVGDAVWSIWRCQCDAKVHYATVGEDGKRYFHDGWVVSLRLNQ